MLLGRRQSLRQPVRAATPRPHLSAAQTFSPLTGKSALYTREALGAVTKSFLPFSAAATGAAITGAIARGAFGSYCIATAGITLHFTIAAAGIAIAITTAGKAIQFGMIRLVRLLAVTPVEAATGRTAFFRSSVDGAQNLDLPGISFFIQRFCVQRHTEICYTPPTRTMGAHNTANGVSINSYETGTSYYNVLIRWTGSPGPVPPGPTQSMPIWLIKRAIDFSKGGM